ncbi:glycosyltransferase family 39 protein [Candidatus Sumerlaeota bacterium]|nr:glycosyltransferase family 39 protein [Candidatus Sumerlaeota bacterium]
MSGKKQKSPRSAHGRPKSSSQPPAPRHRVPVFREDPEPIAFFASPWKPLPIVALAAIAVRGLQFFFIRSNDPSFACCLSGVDTYTYDQWALKILAGDWASRSQPVFYYGPAYPYFLALVYGAFGHRYGVAHLAQFLLGVLASLGVFLGASQWFSGRVAMLGALFVAFCPGVLFYESTLLPEAITFIAVSASLWTMGLTHRRPDRMRLWPVMGLCFGLMIVQRASSLLCVGAVAFWVSMCFRSWTWRKKTLVFGLFMAGVVLPLVPTTLHNRLIGGKWVLVTSNGPNLLYIGNAHDASGTFEYPPSFFALQDEQKKLRARADSIRKQLREIESPNDGAQAGALRAEIARIDRERDNLPKTRLRSEILNRPATWLKLMARKAYMFWGAFDPPDNFSYELYRWFSPAMKWNPFGFAILAPLGLVGLALAARRWRDLFLLYAFIVLYWASIVLVFVVGRYRLPVLLPLAGFSALTVCRLWEWVRNRRLGPALIALGAVAALVWALGAYYVAPFRIRYIDFGMFASYYKKTDRLDEAIDILRRGEAYYLDWKPRTDVERAMHPFVLVNLRMNLAETLFSRNDFAGAETVLEAILRSGQADAKVVGALAHAYAAQGKTDQARALLEQTIPVFPQDAELKTLLDQIGPAPNR